MDKEIVIIVNNENAAYSALKALKALDDEGSIELYASSVIAKDANGVATVKDTRQVHGPWGTALGLSTGALIGLIAGPVGVAIGAAIGGAAGLGGDLAYSGFAGEFVQGVSARLAPGKCAVCASIWEDWTVPVDAAVTSVGGEILRQSTEDVVIAQIRAEMQALKEEQAQHEAEIARASAEVKTKLEAKREEIRAKHTARRERLQKRAQELQAAWTAKIASIEAKVSSANAEAKARHEQHMEKLGRFAELQKQSFRELFS